MDMFREVLLRGISYNFIEAALIVILALSEAIWGVAWLPLLWTATGAAALWVLASSTKEAQDHAEDLILDGDIYLTDWMIGSVLMFCLSLMTLKYGLQFAAIFLVATVQNLRYTALSYHWLCEEQERARRKEGSDRDNLPPV